MAQAPREQRVEVAPEVTLRTLSWDPVEPATSPDFLLVHGLASNALLWRGVAERLTGAGHRVVAVDQRGHGASDRGPGDDVADLATLVADLRAVMHAAGLERPVAVGQSWGGNVVLELAARAPEDVLGVAGIDGGTIDLAGRFPDWDRCRQELTPPALAGLSYEELERRLRGRYGGWPEAAVEGQLANVDVRPDGSVAPHLALDDHLAILRQLWDCRPADVLPAVTVPVLLLPVAEPDDDRGTAEKRRTVAMAEDLLADVRVRWFEGYAHDVHAQAPDEVAAELLRAAAAWRDGSGGTP